MSEKIKKPEELIELQDKMIELIFGEDLPEDEEIYKILDDIYFSGYNEALKYTWKLEESGDYIRTDIKNYMYIGEEDK